MKRPQQEFATPAEIAIELEKACWEGRRKDQRERRQRKPTIPGSATFRSTALSVCVFVRMYRSSERYPSQDKMAAGCPVNRCCCNCECEKAACSRRARKRLLETIATTGVGAGPKWGRQWAGLVMNYENCCRRLSKKKKSRQKTKLGEWVVKKEDRPLWRITEVTKWSSMRAMREHAFVSHL